MRKRLQNFIVALIAGALILAGALRTIFTEANVDLNKSSSVVGVVSLVEMRTKYSYWRHFDKLVFLFRLKGVDQNFSIYKPDHTYMLLKDSVRVNDTVRVFYKPSKDQFNLETYQVEKGEFILYDHLEFSKLHSSMAGYMLIFGAIFLVGGIIYYTRFNLWKWMLDFVK